MKITKTLGKTSVLVVGSLAILGSLALLLCQSVSAQVTMPDGWVPNVPSAPQDEWGNKLPDAPLRIKITFTDGVSQVVTVNDTPRGPVLPDTNGQGELLNISPDDKPMPWGWSKGGPVYGTYTDKPVVSKKAATAPRFESSSPISSNKTSSKKSGQGAGRDFTLTIRFKDIKSIEYSDAQ